jgi:hypothetical protein
MAWMFRSWITALAVSAVGCSDRSGSEGDDGTSAATTEGGTTQAGTEAGTGTDDDETSATAAETTSPADPCDGFTGGGSCTLEGHQCTYGDDCGGSEYRCEDGQWVKIDGWGCEGDPVACADGPVDGDSCDFDEPCDLDGDCLDVLECDAYTWRAYAVCSEVACAEPEPHHGAVCSLEEGRVCQIDHACGLKMFTCHEGYWTFNGSAICEEPVPCEEGPVPYEACETEDEVCEYADPDEPPVVCEDGVWE